MIAFTIAGLPIYWYGLFYLFTFLVGYGFLYTLGTSSLLAAYPAVKKLLSKHLDDFFIIIIVGVIIGGRLGHVFFYEWFYYSQNLKEILMMNQGGMSFVGGVLGVILGMVFSVRKWKLQPKDLFVLGDIALCIVPLGILLGRFGNYLNQELWGKPLTEIGTQWASLFEQYGLSTVYDSVDQQERVNTNFIESMLEGGVALIITITAFMMTYIKKKWRPGTASGLFLVWYSIARFFVEQFKDLPSTEIAGVLSISQRMMIVFFIAGIGIIINRTLTIAE